MPIDLAILICTLENRKPLFERVCTALDKQIDSLNVRNRVLILFNRDTAEATTGKKRNYLVMTASIHEAKYIAFFDDDDLPGPNYIKNQLAVVDSGKDCGELWGNIYFSGKKGKPFHHSIEYKEWFETPYKYCRNPNHLNCLRLEAVREIKYQDKYFGEDGNYSIDLQRAGVLKTMHPCGEFIYHYFTGNKGTQTELDYAKSLGV